MIIINKEQLSGKTVTDSYQINKENITIVCEGSGTTELEFSLLGQEWYSNEYVKPLQAPCIFEVDDVPTKTLVRVKTSGVLTKVTLNIN